VLLATPTASARLVGDEAAMLARTLADVPVAVGKRRERAIEFLAEHTQAQVALLDDGFQYFRLHKLADIVLLDALVEPSGQRLFPAGWLREPPSHLQRATQVWLTHCDQVSERQLSRIREFAARWAPGAPVVITRHRPAGLRRLDGEPLTEYDLLSAERPVVALSGLGNPRSFEASVAGLGVERVIPCRFADHRFLTADDMALAAQTARRHQARWIVTTEKDAVRICHVPADVEIAVLDCRLDILAGHEHIAELIAHIKEFVTREHSTQEPPAQAP